MRRWLLAAALCLLPGLALAQMGSNPGFGQGGTCAALGGDITGPCKNTVIAPGVVTPAMLATGLANSILATNGAGAWSNTATLPALVQSNITGLGTVTSGAINGITGINNTPIGATTQSTGAFTTMTLTPPASVGASTNYFQMLVANGTNPLSVGAGSEYDAFRITQADGSFNSYTVGAGSVVSGFNSQIESGAGSDATSNTYGGVLHARLNSGGIAKGAHIEVIATTSATGVIVGEVTEVISAANISQAIAHQITIDDSTNPSAVVPDLISVNSITNGTGETIRYGFLLSSDISIVSGGAMLHGFAKGTGDFASWLNSGGSADLFQVKSTGATGIGLGAGSLVGGVEMLSISGLLAAGVDSSHYGLFGYTGGAGTFVMGTNNSGEVVTVRAGGTTAITISGSTQNVVMSTSTVMAPATALATTATNPFPYIPTSAGTPTGVPNAAAAGRSAIINDTTNHKLCWYEQANAAWKCALGS